MENLPRAGANKPPESKCGASHRCLEESRRDRYFESQVRDVFRHSI